MIARATLVAALVVLVVAASCASASRGSDDRAWSVKVYNGNWYAHTVRLDCVMGGGAPVILRGLLLGETRRSRQPYRGCHGYDVTVMGLGGRVYRFPQATQTRDGTTICVDIGPQIHQTFVYECVKETDNEDGLRDT